ncbi:hypothetical protein HaLaN_26035 [Haematococcus lacustris]|uniref:Uncharacterized protein n=1 Tax=Haematococcus lacustris TaxID=44745 RepID=A0A6A0A5A5_HAELA|nr:hypothetical protein HaLaN_26035 [Haematococcus lacustris]
MSIHHMPSDGPPTPCASTKGSRASLAGCNVIVHPARCQAQCQCNKRYRTGALCSEYLHEDYQPHVGDS